MKCCISSFSIVPLFAHDPRSPINNGQRVLRLGLGLGLGLGLVSVLYRRSHNITSKVYHSPEDKLIFTLLTGGTFPLVLMNNGIVVAALIAAK